MRDETIDLINLLIKYEKDRETVSMETMTLIKGLINVDRRRDSVELGKAGERFKVYFDASNPIEARQLVENAGIVATNGAGFLEKLKNGEGGETLE